MDSIAKAVFFYAGGQTANFMKNVIVACLDDKFTYKDSGFGPHVEALF